MKTQKAFAYLILLCLCCGCSFGFAAGRTSKTLYVLMDGSSEVEKAAESLPISLLIRDARAPYYLNGRRIVFSDSPAKRGYYQLASWVEAPPKRFTALLLRRLEKAGHYASVTHQSSTALADYQLNTELVEFYHNISSSPGSVHVEVNAELVDVQTRELLSRKNFSRTVKIEEYDVDGAVEGFSRCVGGILDELLEWMRDAVAAAQAASEAEAGLG